MFPADQNISFLIIVYIRKLITINKLKKNTKEQIQIHICVCNTGEGAKVLNKLHTIIIKLDQL